MILSEEERMYLTRDLWECISPPQSEEYPDVKPQQQQKRKHAPPPRRRSTQHKKRTITQQNKRTQKMERGNQGKTVPPANRGVVFIMATSASVAGFMLAGLFVCLLFAGLIVM